MKRDIIQTSKFKKDLKLAIKRGKNTDLLDEIVDLLASGKPLPPKNKDHDLKGNYKGFRECHITPDWLLVYKVTDDKLVIVLTRTGSHADLFNM